MRENPFTPSFGEIPAHLAGRRQIIEDFDRAFTSERRRPELTTLISGARGTGKTTLLSLVANRAEQVGWIAASTTAMPGMLEDLELGARKRAEHLVGSERGTRISSIGIPQIVDIEFDRQAQEPGNWRLRMDAVLDKLEESGTGLLITVDEIDVDLDEMVQLAAFYQHFVRENRKVALLMAGLPHNVSSLMNDKTVSFLRRAQSVQLGRIADYDIEAALAKTVREGGRTISEESLRCAVKAIDGFPFMMQLVGFRAWDANPDAGEISADDVERGIALAREEMRGRILEATYRDLSPEDIRFAEAMLEDAGDSQISDITARLGRSSSQVSQYRTRLIEAGVIGQRRRGVVGFDMLFFREFLQDKKDGKV